MYARRLLVDDWRQLCQYTKLQLFNALRLHTRNELTSNARTSALIQQLVPSHKTEIVPWLHRTGGAKGEKRGARPGRKDEGMGWAVGWSSGNPSEV